jgi:hypothetical protein
MSTESFTHDVFLSHSAKDKAVVRPVAGRLRLTLSRLSTLNHQPTCGPLNQERRFIPLRLDDAPMLVTHTSDGEIRLMDVNACRKRESAAGKTVRQIVFEGGAIRCGERAELAEEGAGGRGDWGEG